MFCEDGKIRGYLNRTIPNAISTDLQGEEIHKNEPVQVITGIINQIGKMRTRGAHKMVCQEIEKYQIERWSKPKLVKGQVVGIDKRLLNISVMDGGYGLTINGKPPMRAKVVV